MTEQSQKDDGSATEIEAPNLRELTPREERFVSNLASGKVSNRQAAIDAGYSAHSASTIASQKLSDENIRNAVRERMYAAGLGPDGTVAKLRELLDARQYGLTKDGDVVDMGPDAHAQAKVLDMGLKVLGAYPNPKLDVNANVNAAVVVIRAEDALAGLDPFSAPQDVTPGPESPDPSP